MARTKATENATDPATGRPLPPGVSYRGPAQYRARKLVDGARVARTFETARTAREWLEETSVRAREGTFVDRRPLDQSTLAELVQRYVDAELQDGGRRRGAAEDRGHVPSILNDSIGKLPLSRVTPAAVRGFRDRQKAKHSPGTVVKRLNMLAGVIAHAIGEWDIPMANPATSKLVPRPKGADVKRDRRLRLPSAADIRAAVERGEEPPKTEEELVLSSVAKSEWPDDVLVVRFAIAQAARQGEILALRWGDIDEEARLLTIRGRHGRGTKTGSTQKAARTKAEVGWEVRPLMPEALAVLREKRGDCLPAAGDIVFQVGPSAAFKVRIGRRIAAACDDLTFHDFRHEATSRLAKRYSNPMDLKRVTGHRDLKSLDRYYQPDLTELAMVGEAA